MKIFTVSELTQEVKVLLETHLCSLSVRGEIINLKIQSSGHIYFTLKDKDAQISSVLFKGSYRSLSRLPKEGDQIIATGEVSVYPPRGAYQLIVRDVRFEGVGELLVLLHERKNKFQAMGYFAKERKKKLPSFPHVIGVVTSPTGAVIQDIIQILDRRHSGFQLLLFPVKVQGEGAKEEIAKAIDECNRYALADVIIVGRGGGSLEDLWAFNEEIVVEAIVRSKIPIISAVGHETDVSLSDFAADVRAPTPSAAAELVITEKQQYTKTLTLAQEKIQQQTNSLIRRLKQQLLSVKKNPYLASPYLLLSRRLQELDDSKIQLDNAIITFLKQKKSELVSLEKRHKALEPVTQIRIMQNKLFTLQRSLEGRLLYNLKTYQKKFTSLVFQKKIDSSILFSLQKKKERLSQIASHLHSINPKNLLTKGYCILFSENRDSVILSAKQITVTQEVKILLHDGLITAKTEEITYEPT